MSATTAREPMAMRENRAIIRLRRWRAAARASFRQYKQVVVPARGPCGQLGSSVGFDEDGVGDIRSERR
jgi:hypothetical protein